MDYPHFHTHHTSNQPPSWFQQRQLDGYIVPKTHPLPEYERKGIKFDKAERSKLFLDRRNSPSPGHYFRPDEKQVKQKVRPSSFFGNYSRFEKNSLQGMALHFLPEVQPQPVKKGTLSRAELVGFIDNVTRIALDNPAFGSYDPKIRRHHSLSLFSKGKKNSFPAVKNDKKIKEPSIGPDSYVIPRSISQACSSKFVLPYKENDEKMKEKAEQGRKQKAKETKAGPGQYLQLQEWCKYRDRKKLANGMNACSRPNQLRIY